MDTKIYAVVYNFYDHWIEEGTFYSSYEEAKAAFERLKAAAPYSGVKDITHGIEEYILKGNNAS